MFLYTWDKIKRKENMSDLRIKPNKDNGDLPKQKDLFDGGDNEMNWEKKSFNPNLSDIFNPTLLREKFEKINGHTNKDKQ